MPKKTNERLEELEIVHETLEMMIQLIKDLGFEPPPDVSPYQRINGEKAATLYGERLNDIYQGYATMLENRERYKVEIDAFTAQNAESPCTDMKKSSCPQQKTASKRRAKRRVNPWDRPKRRQRQPNLRGDKASKSPLSNEIV